MPPGVLRISLYAEPTSLNPILATNTAENFVDGLFSDLLITLDDKGNDVPDLAETVPTLQNGGISKDGRTITYHLRHNVKWQDGAPFTSADVKFTWQAVMNPNNNVVERRGYDQVAKLDTPDPYTVVFHLKQPFAPFVDTVFAESDGPFRLLPRHLLAKYPDINKVSFNQLPIGTGPFKVTRWIHGQQIEMTANPDYFRGKPKLSKIILQVVPDANTAAAMLRSKGTDLIIDLPAANYRNLKNDSSVRLMLVKAPVYSSVLFNQAHPPLDDVVVRRALSYAIDEKRIVDNLTYGTAVLATSDLADFYWAYDPNVPTYPYDPKKAAALLDQAGWKAGPNGTRQKNGHDLVLQLAYGSGNETARAIGVQVQADLAQIGVQVQVKSYLYSVLYATKATGGILSNGKFDLAEWSWVSGADPDDSSQWMCDEVPPAGNNYSRYCNPQIDAAERVALGTFDRSVRKKAYSQIQRTLAADAASAFQYYQRLRYAMNPALQNFTPNGPSEGWNAYEWSI